MADMSTGKIASAYYDRWSVPREATGVIQFGNVLSMRIGGEEIEYQVQPGDTFEKIDRAFERLLELQLVEV